MSTVNMTTEKLKETMNQNKSASEGKPHMILLDFWADWCGPCKMFSPIFEEVSNEHPDVVFGKVDIEDRLNNDELTSSFQIKSIPTLAVIVDGSLAFLQAGAMSKNDLNKVVNSFKEAQP